MESESLLVRVGVMAFILLLVLQMMIPRHAMMRMKMLETEQRMMIMSMLELSPTSSLG